MSSCANTSLRTLCRLRNIHDRCRAYGLKCQRQLASPNLSYCLRRSLKTATHSRYPSPRDIAFAFDIDGVLLRSAKPVPSAREALQILQRERIPFILLTNGGGKRESERVAELSERLGVPLSVGMFVQSHTPFAELAAAMLPSARQHKSLRDKCILVLGGEGDKCRLAAEANESYSYGFTNVVTPADIITAHPTIWPFSNVFASYYAEFARPLPAPLCTSPTSDETQDGKTLKIDAMFVFNDPRDWALDAHLILDLLLSRQGLLGTVSSKNGDESLPNRGFQQDGQPALYFSNPDLWWAAAYHLPRLGQGGFREALEGVWAATTGGPANGVHLHKKIIGKPYHDTYAFAEERLLSHRAKLHHSEAGHATAADGHVLPLRRVYMVGDNPESDIKGANDFVSPVNADWTSVLVRTGVYTGGQPSWKPKVIVDDVLQAVKWALKNSTSDLPT
ncbi:MAG: hypothetical protein M1825_004125 [Sarcosagium campestre]|nr:MAG: hypothetical protein M1825_004125 [Sarcosagium campestre]